MTSAADVVRPSLTDPEYRQGVVELLGLLGAIYVASVTMLGPRLGAMTMVALVIAGQLTVALVVDQFGILGYPQIAVTPTRLLGAALLLAGALLVVRR